MINGDDDQAHEGLGEYWDALNQGTSETAPDHLDPTLTGTIQRLHALDNAHAPDPTFVTRLEQEIMSSAAPVWVDLNTTHQRLAGSLNGHAARRLPPRGVRHGWPRVTSLVTAALVLLTLIGGYVAVRGSLSSRLLGDRLPTLPALMAPDDSPLSFVREITGGSDPMQAPAGVAAGADGTVYVIDAARDQIRIFDAEGNPLAAWGESGTGPGQFGFSFDFIWGDVAVAPDGNLYVLDTSFSRIQKFTPAGEFLLGWGELGSGDGQLLYPKGIGVDANGQVYIADWGNHRVQVFDGEGALLASWDGSQEGGIALGGPTDVAIDALGTAWVTDEILQQIVGFAPDGRVVATIGKIGSDPGEMRGPWGIAIDAAGNLYVAETDGERVQVFAPDGASLGIIDDGGAELDRFTAPSYVAVGPDGAIYVTDDGNHRLQQFGALAS